MFNKRQSTSSGHDTTSTNFDLGTSQPAAANAVARLAAAQANASDGVVIIGKGTRIVGEITDCSRVEIQGIVDGTIVAETLIIREGGSLTGRLQATHAEVHGSFNGQLDIAELLDIRSTGTVEGELAYGKLAVAMGGHISGNVTNPRLEAAGGSYGREAEVEPVRAAHLVYPYMTGTNG